MSYSFCEPQIPRRPVLFTQSLTFALNDSPPGLLSSTDVEESAATFSLTYPEQPPITETVGEVVFLSPKHILTKHTRSSDFSVKGQSSLNSGVHPASRALALGPLGASADHMEIPVRSPLQSSSVSQSVRWQGREEGNGQRERGPSLLNEHIL